MISCVLPRSQDATVGNIKTSIDFSRMKILPQVNLQDRHILSKVEVRTTENDMSLALRG